MNKPKLAPSADRAIRSILLLCCAATFAASSAGATPPRKVVFGSPTRDLVEFEQFASRAKRSGATYITVTAEDLPWSSWQYDTPGDPYPTWVISNLGLLKIAPPAAIRPFVSVEYAEKVMSILEERCRILRRLGLKAAFHTFEPQMLPEALFEQHPAWRGPRVDHPLRSRVARFSPSLDHPAVLALYREAMATIVARCPEIELLTMRTNDSGAGIDWSRGLYSGRSGNTEHQGRPMEQRLVGFFGALRDGARQAGSELEIDIYNTKELEPRQLAAKFPRGMAIENVEGPGATPYKANAGTLLVYNNFFHPVRGIPQVGSFLEELERAASSKAPRLFIGMPDRVNRELYFQIHDAFVAEPTNGDIARHFLLKKVATALVQERDVEKLVAVWRNLREAEKVGALLSVGAAIVYGGGVMNRWLTRPLVPFPDELRPEEKEHFRRFIMQARTETHAENLTDFQATEVFTGWSGNYFVGRIIGEADAALSRAQEAGRSLTGKEQGAELVRRIEIVRRFLRTARHAVSYQAQLDRVRQLDLKPESRPPAVTQPSWDRQMMLETARAEIDNVTTLIELLEPAAGELLELAASPAEEDTFGSSGRISSGSCARKSKS